MRKFIANCNPKACETTNMKGKEDLYYIYILVYGNRGTCLKISEQNMDKQGDSNISQKTVLVLSRKHPSVYNKEA